MPNPGLDTIAQRIAGITQRPAATTRATPPPAASFATQLSAQLDTQQPTAAVGTAPNGSTTFQEWTAPNLPPGVRFSGQPSLILPALPTPATGAADVTEAVGSSCNCGRTHGLDPVALDRVGPPPELTAYGNGRIPADALEPLGIGDHMLWSPAARAFRDLRAAAARDGISFEINSSYRSYERQVQLADQLGLYSQGGLAAAPGTSNHGWGVSIDLGLDDDAVAWMRENAADYGFVEDVPREPWHWTFKGSDY